MVNVIWNAQVKPITPKSQRWQVLTSANANARVDQQRQNAVNRKEIWRERNPEVALVCNDVAAVPGDLELAHPAAHEPDPEHMGELMPEHVNEHRPWKPEKSDQPEQCAE